MSLIISNLKKKPFLIAEVGQAHDGSLGTAHSYIDLVADTGFDAIKFQTHFAKYESTINEKFRVKFSYQDKDRYEYWKRMEFTSDQWKELNDHAVRRGIYFLSSPFSIEAFKLLEKINVPAWKIASGEYKSWELINLMIKTGKPIFVSTGMSTWKEISYLIRKIKKNNNEIVLMQCTSMYPTPLNKVGLNIIDEFRRKFKFLEVGLSDHSGTVWPSIVSMSKNVAAIEVHVTFHKKSFGPDVSSSLSEKDLCLIVEARRHISELKNSNVDKDFMAKELKLMRNLFTKSISLKQDFSKGKILSKNDLTLKKPGGGIPEEDLKKVIGRKLKEDVRSNRLLKWDDLTD